MEKYVYWVTFGEPVAQETMAVVTEDLRRFFHAEEIGAKDNKQFKVVCSLNPTRAQSALDAFSKVQPHAVLTSGVKLTVED